MGCSSSTPVSPEADGDEAAFLESFVEDKFLGEGQFGTVKLVKEKENPTEAYACKILPKGDVIKDGLLYPAIPVELLWREIEILQKLVGDKFCMKLVAVYETPKTLMIISEYCAGGVMNEYVSSRKEDLRTEDISLISFQLLSAVDHCATHNIIHRDIKPENIMFTSSDVGAELRLIDFGSGTYKATDGMNTTFVGTAFYNSPEMFKKTYDSKTDVWSAGVTLYVLVAGYPSEFLQDAFNILLDAKRKNTRQLPNMPDGLPNSYFEMLDGLLTFKPKHRKPAGIVLFCDFVQFHKALAAVERQSISSPRRSRVWGSTSMVLTGNRTKHRAILDFNKFELSLTAAIATMLDREDFHLIRSILDEKVGKSEENPQLRVVKVFELKEILVKEVWYCKEVMEVIEGYDKSNQFNNYSYNTNLLKLFDKKRQAAEKGAEANRKRSNSANDLSQLLDHSDSSMRSYRSYISLPFTSQKE